MEPSYRLTGQEIVSNFPPGVCCEAPLEVYENSNDPPIQRNVELDMASSLGIQNRQAPSSPPKHVQGPTITVDRTMVRTPMPEALNESMPLLGRRHETTPRLLNHLENLSWAEESAIFTMVHNSNPNSDSNILAVIMAPFIIITMTLSALITAPSYALGLKGYLKKI